MSAYNSFGSDALGDYDTEGVQAQRDAEEDERTAFEARLTAPMYRSIACTTCGTTRHLFSDGLCAVCKNVCSRCGKGERLVEDETGEYGGICGKCDQERERW